jgi:hypothetical protein
MGDVVDFKRPKTSSKFVVTVCDSKQKYQVFEVESVSTPKLEPAYKAEAWFGGEEVTVDGPNIWSPVTIEGDKEIADAIQYGDPPIRVTFGIEPATKHWWELHEVYLSTESEEEKHILFFMNCNEHKD